MSDFCGHFDIWNYLEKNFFSNFFKIHRGDPYDFGHNCKGPPYEFWKNEKKMQNFFFSILFQISKCIKISIVKIFSKLTKPPGLAHNKAAQLGNFTPINCPIVQPYCEPTLGLR